VGHVAGGVGLSQARPASLPLSSFNIPRTEHVPGPSSDTDIPALHNPNQNFPARQSAVSRAFVRTIGRLGRWKRVLKPKSPILTAKAGPSAVVSGNAVSAFDLEINASVDLLTTDRGVEEYLKMADRPPVIQSPTISNDKPHSMPQTPSIPSISLVPAVAPITTPTISPPSESTVQKAQNPPSSLQSPSAILITPPLVRSSSPSLDEVSAVPNPTAAVEDLTESQQDISSSESLYASSIIHDERVESGEFGRTGSFRSSSSTDSFGAPLTSNGPLPPTFPGTHQPWQFDVISIDDLDFSDTSSLPGGLDHPPGLRKQRKLPMRRDFEFVRRSEVSSMGIVSQESLRVSVSSSVSETSPTASINAGPQPIKRWQMKSLQQTFEDISNSSDDKGDVDAALRRLEGQINPKVLQENAEKVNGWVRNLQERMANGDYENSIFSEDEVEDFIDEVDATPPVSAVSRESEEVTGNGHGIDEETKEVTKLTQSMHQSSTPPSIDISLDDSQTLVEGPVPAEILQSRMSTAASPLNSPLKFTTLTASRVHRSFILNFPAEQLAQHLTMIDRELFMSIKFEELVTGEWLECEEIDVIDWAQYLKDRARWKAESRYAHKTTALAALRARFNLTVAFVNAEVVLTPPNERSSVVGKFIRIAWVCCSIPLHRRCFSNKLISTATN